MEPYRGIPYVCYDIKKEILSEIGEESMMTSLLTITSHGPSEHDYAAPLVESPVVIKEEFEEGCQEIIAPEEEEEDNNRVRRKTINRNKTPRAIQAETDDETEIEDNQDDAVDETEGNTSPDDSQENGNNAWKPKTTTANPNNDADQTNKDAWRSHMKTTEIKGDIWYQCTDCGKVMKDAKNMKPHIHGQHLGVRYPCAHCGHTLRSKSTLITHIRRIHPGVTINCPRCPYTTLLESSLAEHQVRYHPSASKKASQAPKVVDGKTAKDWKMYLQKIEENGQKRYKCTKCGRCYKHRIDLTRHVKEAHFGLTYPCPHPPCGYAPRNRSALVKHIRALHLKNKA